MFVSSSPLMGRLLVSAAICNLGTPASQETNTNRPEKKNSGWIDFDTKLIALIRVLARTAGKDPKKINRISQPIR